MILSCSNIAKSFQETPVIRQASFHIEENEKAAIVGINGAGKTTLLRMIVGELPADTGTVTFAKGATFGYLAQQAALDMTSTIYGELLSVKQDLVDLEDALRRLEEDMKHADGSELERLMQLYTAKTADFEARDGYRYKSELSGVLKGLGFEEADYNKSIATLSGGQKTRVCLAKLLLENPDLIILDEPTNHLDISSISWLETYLLNYKGAVLIVSHDRYFLDRIVTKVISIEGGEVRSYQGNYTQFAQKAAQLRSARIAAYMKQQAEIKHQQQVIDKLKSFNREKSVKRAQSREKVLDKMERLEKPAEIRDDMQLRLVPQITSGNDVLSVRGVSKSFPPLTLFTDADIEIKRGEHVAVIGDNGTGKTTFLKMINGLETIDSGEIVLGTNVEIGYYDQEHHVLHGDKTLFDEISDDYPQLTNTQIRNTLAAFLFTGDDVFQKIETLSGGERGRVSLAKLMLSNANFLILDEPTNHLDITSKEILEHALNQYEGTVLYVSHDRYFVNRTATRILDLSGQKFYPFGGNYDYYMEKRAAVEPAASPAAESRQAAPAALSHADSDAQQADGSDSSAGRLSWQEQKALQAQQRKKEAAIKRCEDRIAVLEARIEELNVLIADPVNAVNSVRLQELTNEQTSLSAELDEKYDEWEALHTD